MGLVSTSFVKTLGQDPVPLSRCHRDGSGVGLLRHSLARPFRLFRSWRLHDRHVADVCPHRRHRARVDGAAGPAANRAEVRDAIGTQIFGVVGGSDIPFVWILPEACRCSFFSCCLCRACWRSSLAGSPSARASPGVYLSILTQAMTLALSLYLFQNDSGLRGNNGLSGLQNMPGLDGVPQAVVSLWFLWASALALALGYLFAAWMVERKVRQHHPRHPR